MATIISDAQKLLDFAKDWYRVYQGVQIPRDVWDDLVGEEITANASTISKHRVCDGTQAVVTPSANIIPALAAISLGLKTAEIHAIVLHHGVDMDALSKCEFSYVFKPAGKDDHPGFTRWTVTTALMKAFCHLELDSELFFGTNTGKKLNPTQCMALLTVPKPAIWPVTGISGHLQGARQRREPHDTQLRSLVDSESFSEAKIDLKSLTDDQFFQLFERTGNLTLGATSENGFTCNYFKEMFIEMGLDKEPNHLRLTEVFNRLTEGDVIERVRRRVLEELGDGSFETRYFSDSEYILEGLEKHFDHDKFGRLHDDIILKLNIVEIGGLDNFAKILTRQMPDCYKEFFDQGDQILNRLNNALASIEPVDFKTPHFRALKVVTRDWGRAQDLSQVDLTALLKKSLEAYESYLQENHVDLRGFPQQASKDNARHHLVDFAKYALRHIDHDYEQFTSMSSDAKAILAMAGMDIKKLPGITRQDRGRVLVDQLGL